MCLSLYLFSFPSLYLHSHLKCALFLQWTASPSSSAELKPKLQKTSSFTTCISTRRLNQLTSQSTSPAHPPHQPPRPPHCPLPLSDLLSLHLLYHRHHRLLPPLLRSSPRPHLCSRQALWCLLEVGWEVSHICTSCILCRLLRPAPWACREQGSWPAMYTASRWWYSRCPSCTLLLFDHPPASTTPSCYLCWMRSKARAKVGQLKLIDSIHRVRLQSLLIHRIIGIVMLQLLNVVFIVYIALIMKRCILYVLLFCCAIF